MPPFVFVLCYFSDKRVTTQITSITSKTCNFSNISYDAINTNKIAFSAINAAEALISLAAGPEGPAARLGSHSAAMASEASNNSPTGWPGPSGRYACYASCCSLRLAGPA